MNKISKMRPLALTNIAQNLNQSRPGEKAFIGAGEMESSFLKSYLMGCGRLNKH